MNTNPSNNKPLQSRTTAEREAHKIALLRGLRAAITETSPARIMDISETELTDDVASFEATKTLMATLRAAR